jgi:chromosome segregation ATPase
MENYKEKLEEIEQTINENKEKLIRCQEKEKQLTEDKNEILKQLEDLKLTPDTLEKEIVKLDKEIKVGIDNANNILNGSPEEEPEPTDED